MEKNDELIVKIEDMSETGEGIGHANGLALFVKDAVTGDTVRVGITKVKKNYCFARTIEILESSPLRAEPVCPVARPCGGCQLQQISYEAQLDFKTAKVKACFNRLAGMDVEVRPTLGMTGDMSWENYRNKASFPIRNDKNVQPAAGFYAGRTHSIIPTEDCAIEFPEHKDILKTILDFMKEKGISAYAEDDESLTKPKGGRGKRGGGADNGKAKGLVRHVMMRKGFASGEIMVVIVLNGDGFGKDGLEAELVNRLKAIKGVTSIQLNINTENTNVIFGRKFVNLFGPGYITDSIGDVAFKISAPSFYQVNPAQTKVLYNQALQAAGLSGRERVWDLYCGIGTISLFLAKKAGHVYGVEIVPEAIENAKENAELNGITNAEFFVGAAEDVVTECYAKDAEKYSADVVVLDPPRKGADEKLISTILKMAPQKIVYVSCDPATLARDVKLFAAGGYDVKLVQPVDMFPMTTGVETVCLLSNRKPDARVKIDVDLEDYYRIKDEQKKNKASE